MNTRNRRGNIAVLVALMTTGLVAVSAVSLDATRLLSFRNELQFSADAGAHAGAIQLVEPNDPAYTADTAAAWADRLEAVGVPAGRVGHVADALRLATDLGLEPVVEVAPDRPAQVRHPITYSDTPLAVYGAPPRLGEHSDRIRAWLATPEDATS